MLEGIVNLVTMALRIANEGDIEPPVDISINLPKGGEIAVPVEDDEVLQDPVSRVGLVSFSLVWVVEV